MYSKRVIYIPRLSVLNAVNGNEHAEKKGNLSIRRSMLDTGVHKKALIRGNLPGRLARIGCSGRQVSTKRGSDAIFLDTCLGVCEKSIIFGSMKRLFPFLLALCLLAVPVGARAQRVADASYRTIAYIKSDGTLQDDSHKTLGHIKSDGTVQDAAYRTVGHIKLDGTVQDDAYRTIGHVRRDGTVQDAAYRTIGHADGVPLRWTALYFFFLR